MPKKEEADYIDEKSQRAAEEWPAIDACVEAVVHRITKLDRYLDRTLAATAGRHGLNSSDYRLLTHLWKGGAQTPGELGEKVLASSGVMTNRLDRLENRGLVTRKAHPTDRRAVMIELTKEGLAALGRIIDEQARIECEIMSDLSDKELDALNRLLRKAMAALDPEVPLQPDIDAG